MFSRSTLSSSIHIVNRFAAYFSYCSISSKNSILPNAILNYRLGLQNYKLFLILQLFLEFFSKNFPTSLFQQCYPLLASIGMAKVLPFFFPARG